MTVADVLGPWTGPLSVHATRPVAGSNVMRIESRSARIPAVAQSLTYDLDGNILSDGIWDYRWDAENRLIRLETTVAARSGGIAHRILNFTYDYLGHRVQKQVMDGATSTELSSQRFIYNGWDIIAEYAVTGGTTLGALQRTYAWGIDMATSLSDAGGVGALLQLANTTTGTGYMPTYDGNGNVASLVNLGTGALAAAFEYSPYGEMLRDELLDNTLGTYALKFSTKWTDVETGWSNYGRRYYDPRMGRFIGRDPIAETGGLNLYAFCGNDGVNRWDHLGMIKVSYNGYSVDSAKLMDGIQDLPDGSDEDEEASGSFLTDEEIARFARDGKPNYGADKSQYFGTYTVGSTKDGKSGFGSWIGADGGMRFEIFERPFEVEIEIPSPIDDGDPADYGIAPNNPPPPANGPNITSAGTADAADVALVNAEYAKMPQKYREILEKGGLKLVVVRGSVTEYYTDLKGDTPRGWPAGKTWDSVPGLTRGNVVVIATRGHGAQGGPYIPAMGDGHGSYNLVFHEAAHVLGRIMGYSADFQDARQADFNALDAYQRQAGPAGVQETFAESFASVFAGDPNYSTSHPALSKYWAGNPGP